MSSHEHYKQLNLETLIGLVEELEDINSELNEISLGFDSGEIDFAGFELAMLQLKDCQDKLEQILNEPTRPVFIR
jgi:hypothetical protein